MTADADDPTAERAAIEAVRASEPDPLGLMDVMELIAPNARVTGWEPLHGGIDAVLHRIDVTMPSGAETAFVLRRLVPEHGGDAADEARREAAMLEALRGEVVPAPELLWLDTDGAVFGRPAMAVTLLPGRPRSAHVADDPAVVRGLAEALVSLGWVPLDRVSHLEVAPDAAAMTARLATATLPTSTIVDTEAIRQTVVAGAAAVEPLTPVLCHGDFHVGNVLFDGARVTGIVDWSHARILDPRADVAYCALDLALLAGHEVADAFLAEHAALRGPMAEAPWWRLWAATRAFPDPLSWLPSWEALEARVTADEVRERYVAWVEDALADLA